MRIIVYILLFSLSAKAFAQDSIDQKMIWYAKANPTTKLFVHFDKNIYSNNENIWFTGYLLKDEVVPITDHSIMAVTLIRDADSTVILNDKFVMDKGLSFGNIKLPDSLLTGSYRLVAYTNQIRDNKPLAVYIQPITIKTNIDLPFKASMKINDGTKPGDKTNKVLISVTSNEGRFLAKPTSISYRYGKESKTTQTDISGQVLLELPKQDQLMDPNLYVKLKYGKDSTFISMALPQTKSKASVKFYPEGGNLVAGLANHVGWEVKDQQQMPVALKAFLYKNNSVIDTIETGSYGIGQFNLPVEKDAEYTVKLVHDGLADSIYHLPAALNRGLIIRLREAAVKDTLSVTLRTTITRHINIRIHNFKETFLNTPFDTQIYTRTIKIPLNDVPKGLATLTITDSLDRPLAERIFFAHYDPQSKITLITDSQTYQQRTKVNLKLDLIDQKSTALVSVAVVQDNRMETKKTDDIESYSYLKSELNSLPVQLTGIAYRDKNYIEQILLVKGWRKYTWQNLQEAIAKNNIAKIDSLKITGLVLRSNSKPLKTPLDIGTFGTNKFGIIKTDSSGFFNLSYNDLIVPDAKKLFVFLNGANKLTHTIKVHDPYEKLGLDVARIAANDIPVIPSKLINNAELLLKNNEKSIRLKEVLIKSRPDYGFTASGANACGDYVCMYNILNCPNHSSGTLPVKGRQYKSAGGGTIFYQGCDVTNVQGFTLVNGIHQQKEFYINDYKDPVEPAFSSTLYWNHGMLLNNTNTNQISFYTSDITGKFRTVIQGITNGDVIYAEQFFEVIPKK